MSRKSSTPASTATPARPAATRRKPLPAVAGAPATAPRPQLGPIHVQKSSDVLAARIRTQILDGRIAEGAPLPPERDLVLETGLSRGSVREALRILQTEGLVTTRTGRAGGSVACRPGDDALARHITQYVQGRSITLASLLQVREVVEPSIAALAAINRTDEELAGLAGIVARLEATFDDVPAFLAENVNWHVAVAAASHNELLKAFLSAISVMVLRASLAENFASKEIRTLALRALCRIQEAIAARDAEAARTRMARHLAAIVRHMQAYVKSAAPASQMLT